MLPTAAAVVAFYAAALHELAGGWPMFQGAWQEDAPTVVVERAQVCESVCSCWFGAGRVSLLTSLAMIGIGIVLVRHMCYTCVCDLHVSHDAALGGRTLPQHCVGLLLYGCHHHSGGSIGCSPPIRRLPHTCCSFGVCRHCTCCWRRCTQVVLLVCCWTCRGRCGQRLWCFRRSPLPSTLGQGASTLSGLTMRCWPDVSSSTLAWACSRHGSVALSVPRASAAHSLRFCRVCGCELRRQVTVPLRESPNPASLVAFWMYAKLPRGNSQWKSGGHATAEGEPSRTVVGACR